MIATPHPANSAERPSWRAVILFLGSLVFAGSAVFLLATV